MSEKAKCPACESYTSAIYRALREDEPCPYCRANLTTGEPASQTLADFLLARIAEDEADARSGAMPEGSWRMLAECKAKRAIVEDYRSLDADYRETRSRETEARRFQALVSIGQLATAYADHPDYDETWRP